MNKDMLNSISIVFLCVLITFSTLINRRNKQLLKLYKEKSILQTQIVDSLENRIQQLQTDTIRVDSWNFYGDTMQYIGKNDTIVTLPVKYYRLVVTSNKQTKNQTWSVEYKYFIDSINSNDTIQ